MVCVNLDIGSLTLSAAKRLMKHDLTVGKSKSLTLCAAGEQKCAHACSHTDTNCRHIAFDVIHCIVNSHTCAYASSGAVNIKIYILVGILSLKKEKLGNNQGCSCVVYLITKKNDSVLQKS